MTPLTPTSMEEIVNDDEKLQREAITFAKGISSGSLDVAGFIEKLGFALTSTSVEMRVNGTKLLSCVLKQLPNDYLTQEQITFLAAFYADRLKDHHNTMPAIIEGIDALIHMRKMPQESLTKLLNTFFLNTTCQSQLRSDRSKLFAIFKHIIATYTQEINEMGVDFVLGLINSIDGERDPRNLEFIFTFMPQFISTHELYHLVEEMFEIFACYFPIDFNPSRDDPASITRDNLASKLADCLVASTQFAESTVTLALEKLDSDLSVAKLDALELLQRSAHAFPAQSMSAHFEQIWQALKPHIFPGADNADIVSAGLQLLRSLLEAAAAEPELSEQQQAAVLAVVLPHLSDVNQRLFDPAASIVLVCVSADASFASSKILPIFLYKLQNLPEATESCDEQRLKIYCTVTQVFKIAYLRQALQTINAKDETCSQLQQHVIEALRRDLSDNKTDLQRISLSLLAECMPIIAEAQRALIYRILTQIVLHEDMELLDECTELLERMGALHPIEVQTHYVAVCIGEFSKASDYVKRKIFKSMLPLTRQMAFTQRVLDLIFNSIFKEQNQALTTRSLGLEALNQLLKQEDKHFVVNLQHNSNLIDKLVQLRLQLADTKFENTEVEWDVLQQLASALALLVQHLDISEQYIVITQYLPELHLLQKKVDLFVAKGLLGQMHEQIIIDDYFESLLHDLIHIALDKNQAGRMRQVAQQLICSLINKVDSTSASWSISMQKLVSLTSQITSTDETVETLAWVAKALIVRGSNEAIDILNALLVLLDDSNRALAAVRAFEIITREYPEVHLPVVKFLYKQKLFHAVSNGLDKKISGDLENNCNAHHLNAFMHVLKTTPHAVLRLQIEKIGPVLFKVLEGSCDTNTIKIALEICSSLVKEQDKYFGSHLPHIIPSCVQLGKSAKSMHVRIAALELLADLTKYPTYMLLPHKVDTILELVGSLDDHKRLVRRSAANARNAWCLLGALDMAKS